MTQIAIEGFALITETALWIYLFCSQFQWKKQSIFRKIFFILLFSSACVFFDAVGVNDSIKMLILIVISMFVIKQMFEILIREIIIYNMIYFVILIIAETISMGILLCMNPEMEIGIFQQNGMLRFECIVMGKLLNIVLIVLFVKLKKKDEYKYNLAEISIVVLESLVTLFSLCIVVEFSYYQLVNQLESIVFAVWTVGLLVAQIGFFFLFERYIQGKRKEKELLEAQSYMEKQYYYYEQMKQKHEEVGKIKHDIKNMMVSFQNSSEVHKAEIEKYLREHLDVIDDIMIETGSPIANAVLYDKGKIASQKGITFECGIQSGIFHFMEGMDICMLLCQLLDQAIAVSERDDRDKWIYVEGKEKSGYLFLTVSCNCDKQKEQAKKETYGDKKVQTIIEKYQGESDWTQTDSENKCSVMLSGNCNSCIGKIYAS